MKRIHMLAIALLVLSALSAVVASAASAVTFLLAEWLINGAPLTAALNVTNEGELTLINTNGGGFGVRVEILCSGKFDGNVGPNSADEIKELLSLGGTLIGTTALTTTALECTNTKNCEGPLVWAEGLPWKTEAELMEEGTEVFFADLLIGGSYVASCLILGAEVEELCTAPTTAVQLTNEAGGVVDAQFSDAFQELAGLKLGECGGRLETAIVEGLGTIKPDEGSLTVSE